MGEGEIKAVLVPNKSLSSRLQNGLPRAGKLYAIRWSRAAAFVGLPRFLALALLCACVDSRRFAIRLSALSRLV